MKNHSNICAAGLVLLLAPCLVIPVARGDGGWRPITPAELSLATPQVEKDADAEAIFWDIRVEDRLAGGTLETELGHYLRVKVFTERGKESQSRVDIPFAKGVRIFDIAGRTVHSDGSEVALKTADILERTILKARGVKLTTRSFFMPAVEVGSIVEYRWTEIRSDHVTSYERLDLQRDIPVERVTYHIKPIDFPGFTYSMHRRVFNGIMSSFNRESDGYYSAYMTKVPAFHEEPFMPPQPVVRPWMLLYYTDEEPSSPAEYWSAEGKRIFAADHDLTNPTKGLKQAALKAIAGAADSLDELEHLCRFCRTAVRNGSIHPEELTADERKSLGKKSSPANTLEQGFGTGADVDVLFAALARAVGFDARIARFGSRADVAFDSTLIDTYFLNSEMVAVGVGGTWRYFDAADPTVPCGILGWEEEAVQALIPDHDRSRFVMTPSTPAERSCESRVAVVRLEEDGTLGGFVKLRFSGHQAEEKRTDMMGSSNEQRQEMIRSEATRRISGAILSDIRIRGADDADNSLVYSFRLTAPGYAARAGKRLIFQPAVFQHSLAALFPGTVRHSAVSFSYAWAESDSVVISLPEGYALDHADAPGSWELGNVGSYRVSLATVSGGGFVIYRRAFALRRARFDLAEYETLKNAFDAVREGDSHALALIQPAPDSPTPPK